MQPTNLPAQSVNRAIRERFLEGVRASPSIILNVAGGVTALALFAGGLGPCLAGGFSVVVIVEWLKGMGANAMAGWLGNWSAREGQELLQRVLFSREQLDERVLIEALMRELKAQLGSDHELHNDLTKVLDQTQVIPAALDALANQAEEQMRLLSALQDDLRRSNLIQGRLYKSLIYEIQRHQPPEIMLKSLHQLRSPISHFADHAAELDAIVRTLRPGPADTRTTSMVAICGLGGVGKTELAYAVAERLRESFPDAQIMLDLHGCTRRALTPTQALQTIIRAWEPAAHLPDDLTALKALFCSVLDAKRVLILADDARDAAQIQPLLPPHGSAVLVTTRNRFALPGMQAHNLGTLPVSEAVVLLHDICPRIGNHAPALARLCGYLPLALHVSASVLTDDTRDVGRYLERLERERLEHLVINPYDPDASDPAASVEASLRLSYDTLRPVAQAVLCHVSIFPTSFDLDAATAVVGRAEADVEELLGELRRRSLIDWDATNARYSLHELVRLFAAKRLPDRDAVALRHAQYYVQVATEAERLYREGSDNILRGLILFDRERAHIAAAWAWLRTYPSCATTDELLVAYADTTAYVGDLRYDTHREQIPQLQATLEAARRLGRQDAEGRFLGNLGNVYTALGYVQPAIGYLEQALSIARALGDQSQETLALTGLGNACLYLDDTQRAIEYYQQALLISEHGSASALTGLGNIYYALGDMHRAVEYHEQALLVARKLGERRGESSALTGLGNIYYALGDMHRAVESYEQTLIINRALGDRRGEARALVGLGNVYYALGDMRQAIECYEQALVIDRELGNRRREGTTLTGQGNAYYVLGDIHSAIECYEQAEAISKPLGDQRATGSSVGNQGNVYYALGDMRQAIECYEQALVIDRALGDRRSEALNSWNLGLLLEEQGERVQAAELMQVTVDYERLFGHPDADAHAGHLEDLCQRIANDQQLPARNTSGEVGDPPS